MTRPVVVVSSCLGKEACRYNGAALDDPFVASLADHVTLRPVCPELEVGLGVPRDPVRLVARGADVAMVQPKTGLDLTEAMRSFSASFLDGLGSVDGFVLKGRSPSCGLSQVPSSGVTTLLRSWAERFDVAYLRDQVLFEPFPEALARLLDSGKGRES